MGDSVRMTKHRDVTRGSGLRLSCRRSVTTHLEHSGGKIESGSVVVCSGQGLNLRCVAAERVIVCNTEVRLSCLTNGGFFFVLLFFFLCRGGHKKDADDCYGVGCFCACCIVFSVS
ncbi:hypothetical protein CEXT_462301 [Caerostris extrusa]|uniref:Uncharacterized protein n=1 Tax=Caerostris extrusa TaxID=172846 RepID=A0AAV4RXG7_CAEEX|nr:hypothetical protein CEXT_462301 [Caerostris extrusa]